MANFTFTAPDLWVCKYRSTTSLTNAHNGRRESFYLGTCTLYRGDKPIRKEKVGIPVGYMGHCTANEVRADRLTHTTCATLSEDELAELLRYGNVTLRRSIPNTHYRIEI
tara:strand:- start:4644 stop:4973 length:330 start_codon:yes stop_codon:yes gene_type:complete